MTRVVQVFVTCDPTPKNWVTKNLRNRQVSHEGVVYLSGFGTEISLAAFSLIPQRHRLRIDPQAFPPLSRFLRLSYEGTGLVVMH